jgi:septum formation protein
MKKLILASASPTRKKLLSAAGFIFETMESGYDEDMSLPLVPAELAMHLSRGKAEAAAKKCGGPSIVLSADTIIVYGSKILGKPHTPDKAKEMLQMLSGKQHSAITGFTIIDTRDNKIISRAIETKVTFKDLSGEEIADYIKTGEPLDKAGAYAILELGGKFVTTIEGSKTNVAGLPMSEVAETLKGFGILPVIQRN